jgi:putative transposase
MPNAYPREFREPAVELVIKSGRPMGQVAQELGVSATGLQRWVSQVRIDGGEKPGTTIDDRAELVRLRRENQCLERVVEILKASRSGFLQWRDGPPSSRAPAAAQLKVTITAIHQQFRASYGAPRVHAELKLGMGMSWGRKRVARLVRDVGLSSMSHRRKRGGARGLPAPHEDLVKRRCIAERPSQIWTTDITEHPTRTGNVYCAAVLDVFSRRIIGWAIADPIRSEKQGCSARWAEQHHRSITRCWNRSGQRCNANSSTVALGPAETNSGPRSWNGSKPDTTRTAGTAAAATSR